MTAQQLITLLQLYAIDWSGWQRTLEDLLLEVTRGETTFSIDKDGLVRHVHVARAIILDKDGRQLKEHEQTLPSGKVRQRGFPPSGKLTHEENPRAGILRELKEEIGFEENDFASIEVCPTHTEKKEAPSYAGLVSVFTYHDYIMKLHPEAFKDVYEKTEEDGTRTVFIWQ